MSDSSKISPHIQEMIEQYDHDRYLTVLYAPEDKRPALCALYAFNYEISRIRETVSEPMLGEIRLQWWREAIDDVYAGHPRPHEIMPDLATAITTNDLSRDRLMAMIEGRARDLYEDSPKDEAGLEDYLRKTAGNLACLAAHILGQRDADDLAQELGIAWGYIGLIRAVPYHMSLKKSNMPESLMAAHGVSDQKFLSPDKQEVNRAVVGSLCQTAEDHLTRVRAGKKRIAAEARSLYLLSALSRSYLKTIRKADYNPFALEEKADAFFRHWRLLSSALFNRI
tara:strand:- start:512 stop:1357 length:846 start_codon:yes stop_codon:yes gene_type:complete